MGFRLGDVAHLPHPMSMERHVRERGCQGKIRHATDASARGQMDGLYLAKKAPPGTLNVYRCRFCHFHHVGHPA